MSAHAVLSPRDAYRLWAREWDSHPSPIVALESRYLRPWLADLRGKRVLDVACGTGRCLAFAAAQGARVAGVDLCEEMIRCAAEKLGVAARLAVADAAHLPLEDGWADVAWCTLSLGHMRDPAAVMAEMARALRPGGTAIASDFHPEAFRRGWKRTFRSGGRTYEIENHYYSLGSLAHPAMILEDVLEPCFGEPERAIYLAAGRPDLFEQVRGIPAVLLARWRKSA